MMRNTKMTLFFTPALRNMTLYAFGIFMIKGMSLIMLPILANIFSVEQIGKLELLTTLSVFASIMIGLSMHEVLYRFVGNLQDKQKHALANQIYFLALISSASLLPIMILASHLLANHVTSLNFNELMVLCVGLLIEAAIGVSLSWLRMQDRVKHFVWITTGTSLLQISLILIAVNINAGVIGVLSASVIAHYCQFVALHRVNQFTWQLPPTPKIKVFLLYSLPISLSGLLAFSLNGFEKWILSSSSTLADLAVYAISGKFALAMCILVQPFGLWWMPKRFYQLQHHGKQSTTTTTQYGMIWILALTSTMAYVAPLFIQLFLPSSYYPATQYVVLALAIAMLKELSELANIGILYCKKTRILLIINVFAAIIAITLAITLSDFAVWGILTAMLIAQGLRTLAIITFSQYYYALSYQYLALVTLTSLACAHLFLSYYIEDSRIYFSLILIAPITIAITAYSLRLISRVKVNIWRSHTDVTST